MVKEGDQGTIDAVFSVELDIEGNDPVMVDFATRDGTARAGHDYVTRAGTLLFQPGETTKEVRVPVMGDLLDEGHETFFMNLIRATNALIEPVKGGNLAMARIIDDDRPPMLSINDVQIAEGNEAGVMAVFAVTLSSPSGKPVRVDFRTEDGTARSGRDYTAKRGTLTFAPGDTVKTIAIAIRPDQRAEPDRRFKVLLTNPRNATLLDSRGIGTIVDDDGPA